MGLRLVKGRLLAKEDQEGGPPVVLVNESFVKTYLGDREPLGGGRTECNGICGLCRGV